ncbi:MAG: cold shock and DUF1294 domain-containing protein [Rhodanobacter sp.]
MRVQGKITRWDDDKGFGFIAWHANGSSVFVHIKAFFRTTRRPKVGDIVSYEVTKGNDGKSRAERVRFADLPPPKAYSGSKHQSSVAPLVFAALFVGSLLVAAYVSRLSWLVVDAYFLLSFVTFFVYGWDKSSARLGKWRTAESSLHLLDLVGGWPGGLAAQRLLRHKSSKQEFLSMFWMTVGINVVAVGYLMWSGPTNFINQLMDKLWQSAL